MIISLRTFKQPTMRATVHLEHKTWRLHSITSFSRFSPEFFSSFNMMNFYKVVLLKIPFNSSFRFIEELCRIACSKFLFSHLVIMPISSVPPNIQNKIKKASIKCIRQFPLVMTLLQLKDWVIVFSFSENTLFFNGNSGGINRSQENSDLQIPPQQIYFIH